MAQSGYNRHAENLWILAGEASGDLYGATLARALRRHRPDLRIAGLGGAEMAAAGVVIHVDSTELGVVGFVEVVKHLPLFLRVFDDLVSKAAEERPQAVVLIDYPGFNLRFARKMHRAGIKVIWYVSPQVWAWGKKRVPELARLVSRMLVIFPFEAEIYTRVGLHTAFVGHPLVQILRSRQTAGERDDKLILLLPGSRFSEIDRLAMPLLNAAAAFHRHHPGYRYCLAAPRPSIAAALQRIVDRCPAAAALPLQLETGQTEALMARAAAGLAASGTVTVQAAILGLPLVVVYRVNPLTYWIGRALIDIPYIAMPNLIAEREVFEEFIQGAVRPDQLAAALARLLPGGSRYDAVRDGMAEVVKRLGGDSDASENAAQEILAELAAPAP